MEDFRRAVKFVLFSASAGIIQALSFTLLSEALKLKYWPAYLISLILSIVWNFTLNRRYTFRSTADVPAAMAKIFAYYCVFTPVTTVAGDYLAEDLGVNRYIVLAATMLLNMATEYLVCRFWVYRGKIDDRKKPRG